MSAESGFKRTGFGAGVDRIWMQCGGCLSKPHLQRLHTKVVRFPDFLRFGLQLPDRGDVVPVRFGPCPVVGIPLSVAIISHWGDPQPSLVWRGIAASRASAAQSLFATPDMEGSALAAEGRGIPIYAAGDADFSLDLSGRLLFGIRGRHESPYFFRFSLDPVFPFAR